MVGRMVTPKSCWQLGTLMVMVVATATPPWIISTFTGLGLPPATISRLLLRTSTLPLPSVYLRRELVSKNALQLTKMSQFNATRPEPWLVILPIEAASTRLMRISWKNGALILRRTQETRSTHQVQLSITGIPPSSCTVSVFLISIPHKSALFLNKPSKLLRNYSKNLWWKTRLWAISQISHTLGKWSLFAQAQQSFSVTSTWLWLDAWVPWLSGSQSSCSKLLWSVVVHMFTCSTNSMRREVTIATGSSTPPMAFGALLLFTSAAYAAAGTLSALESQFTRPQHSTSWIIWESIYCPSSLISLPVFGWLSGWSARSSFSPSASPLLAPVMNL